MSAIIPFSSGAKLPAYLQNKEATQEFNSEVASGATYTTLSIKGKVFTLKRDKQSKLMTRADDPDEALQSLILTIVKFNTNTRTFFSKTYSDDDTGQAARPTCFTYDGIAPDSGSKDPQSKKCATCKHNVWGDTSTGVGTACSQRTRVAVVDPENIDEPMLLSVPPASRTAFNDITKEAVSRGAPFNGLAVKVSFDPTAATPKLVFKFAGYITDEAYLKVKALHQSDTTLDIIGRPSERSEVAALPAPQDDADAELDAILATREVVAAAKAKPAPVAAVKPKAVPKPVVEEAVEEDEPAPAPVKAKPVAVKAVPKPAVTEDDDLLADLDSLLSSTDD